MDAPLPDDLNDLQRRLAGCRPAEAGLDADRMLFEAGRASAQPGRGRLLWPLSTACLAVLCIILAASLIHERAQRLALDRQVQPVPAPSVPAPAPPGSEPLSPAAYLALRQALERDPDHWPASSEPAPDSPGAPAPAIPRAWDRDLPIDP
jgi:hypothetical protein